MKGAGQVPHSLVNLLRGGVSIYDGRQRARTKVGRGAVSLLRHPTQSVFTITQ